MPEFMILVHEGEAADAPLAPGETRRFLEQQAAYEQKLRALAAFVDGERLRPSAEARRVSRGEEHGVRVEAGPFATPTLEAYYVLQARDLDAALELTAECPVPPGAQVEVRPVMSGHFEPDKTSQKGRVFAFAVLGTAAERTLLDRRDGSDRRAHAGRFSRASVSRRSAARGAESRAPG